MDSSVKNLGEVEYDNQNCLKYKEKPVRRKIRREVNVLILLYISRSITKKFLIETLLKMMDSSVESLGEVEYDVKIWLRYQEIQILPKNSKWGLRPHATVHELVHNKKFPNWNTFKNDRF